MIRIVVVDDQLTVRKGLQMLLALEADIDVVGEAGDGAAAVDVAVALCPDVVLMDVEMPHGDGITATAALRASIPHCAVVMLSLHDDAQTQARARAAGAAAFVAKHDGETTLLAAIRQAAAH